MPMPLHAELPALPGGTEWVNGKVDKEALRGKPVLVHFWAVSCHLCKEGLKIVNFWHEIYGERHLLQIVGVHTPRTEEDTKTETVLETIRRYELEHPVILDHDHAVTALFQNGAVPAYYLFDAQLRLRHIQAGESGLHLLEQRLRKILAIEADIC